MTTSSGSGNDRRALQVLRELLAIESVQERRKQLAQRCGTDADLCQRVKELLAQDGDGDERFDAPLRLQPEVDDDLVGQVLGVFRIRQRIGRGGMGTVYRAEREHAEFRQQVAIKVLRRGLDSDDILARFLRERRILASLSHPNLTRLIDGGRTGDGRPWLAMEFVDGHPITEWCDARRIDPRARIALLLDVAAAVQHAHERLIVHRDLKPGNVLVDDTGHVHLLDFGIAKLVAGDDSESHTVLGAFAQHGLFTPEYAAPEQFTGGTVTAATDVYALGVMLYELLTGRLPHQLDQRDWRSIQTQVLDVRPSRLAHAITLIDDSGTAPEQRLQQRATSLTAFRRLVRGDLERILAKALAVEPDQRYATVQAFSDDLRRFLSGQPVTVAGSHWHYRVGKFVARNRAGVALASVSLALLVAGITGILWQAREAQQQAKIARIEAQRANAVRDYLSMMFREASDSSSQPGQLSARDVLDRSAGRIETEFAGDPVLRQSVLVTMADLYIQLQDYQGARPLLERFAALEDGSSPIEVQVAAWDDLALIALRQGRASEALQSVEAALTLIDANTQGEVQRLRARVLITRGQINRALANIDQAIADLELALYLTQADAASQGRQTAVARNSLALAYLAAGRNEEALREFETSLSTFESLGLGESSDALNVLNNLGSLNLVRGNLANAGHLLERAQRLQRALIGPSAGLAASMLNGARVQLLHNQVEQARAQMAAARSMSEQFTSPDSIDVASAELVLSEGALVADDGDAALAHADNALKLFQHRLPAGHVILGRARTARAEGQMLLGAFEEAAVEIDKALEILEPATGTADTHLARTLCARAMLRLDSDSGAALTDARRCLELRRGYADAGSWEITLASVLELAALLRTGEPGTVRRQVVQVRTQLHQVLAADHPLARRYAALLVLPP